MIVRYYVELYGIEEDADAEILRQVIEEAVRERLPYIELDVAVEE